MKRFLSLIAGGSLILAAGCATSGMQTRTNGGKHLSSQEVKELTMIAPCAAVTGGEDMTLSVDGLFIKNRSKISKEGRVQVDSLAAVLSKYPDQKLTLLVFSDDTPSMDKSIRFTQRRADAVKRELVLKGISKDNVTAFGRGFKNPVALNDSEENRAKNRRVELDIMP